MRVAALLSALILAACGAAVTTPKPSPTPTPTPNVAALYLAAIVKAHDSLVPDGAAFYATKPGTAAESAAASRLSNDYQALLVALDGIPFPADAKDDLSALKKSLVALQIFWSQVSISTTNYSAFTDNSLGAAYSQTGIVLGHDIGVTLVIEGPSPTPTS